MFGLIIALLIGCLVGILTGLIPGLHTNTISIILLGSIAFLSKYFSTLELIVFMFVMVIVHSFLDFIPSIFLGAPEAETALSILPGHNLLLKGEGYKALKLTVVGGVGSFFIGIALLPLFYFFVKYGFDYIRIGIAPIILGFSFIFIWLEKDLKKQIWALIIFILSGVLGVVVLNNLNIKEPLFPLLTGLFGISTLIISMLNRNKITKQKFDDKIEFKGNIFNYLKSSLSAALVSVLPALGAAQATVIAQGFNKFKSNDDYLVMIGGINTVASIFVLTTLFLINKARTGVMATMQQIITLDFQAYAILLSSAVIAVAIGAILTLVIGKQFALHISKIKYRKLSLLIIIFISVLIIFFSGWFGLFIASIATAIGLLAPRVGCRRIHAMGVLVLPVVLYFI